jgi:hypothetical protein
MTVIPGNIGTINNTNPTSMISSVNQKLSALAQSGKLSLGLDHFDVAHPRSQDRGHNHRTIRLLAVLQHRDQGAG